MKFEYQTLAGMLCAAALLAPQIAGAGALPCAADVAADAPNARYSVSGDVVTDVSTGLMWKTCSEGQTGSDCSGGTLQSYTWQGALQQVQTANAAASAGYSDWRLPNRAELASLLERQCSNPAINKAVFPNTPGQGYWTASPYARNAAWSWLVDFNVGDVIPQAKSSSRHVRLVRGGKQ